MKNILQFCEKYEMLPSSGTVLVGVSGGADSMCLLHILLELSKNRGFTVAAAHFNHRLRGEESDGDERFVVEHCSAIGVKCVTGSGDVTAYAREHSLSIEEAARELRYAFFDSAANDLDASRIATAHNSDDNAETVILNMTRGTGLKGYCGIPPVRGRIVRPLLTLSRDDIDAYLAENNIPHREDSTNALDDYSRNRIRHNVISVLKSINPSLSSTVSVSCELVRCDEEYLSSLAQEFILKNIKDDRIPAKKLSALPFPIASRVVRILFGSGLSSRHVDAVLSLAASADPSASLSLPSMTIHREYGFIVRDVEEITFSEAVLAPGSSCDISALGLRFSCEQAIFDGSVNKSFTNFLLKTDSVCGNITIRPRREGDFIRLSEHGGVKTLKKLFIEKKIPARRRASVPVFADSIGVIAVYGLGQDVRSFPKAGDEVLKVTVEEIKK